MRVYPRACGGTAVGTGGLTALLGLSPRVRGNLGVVPIPGSPVGSIPARAGEPAQGRYRGVRITVYPRACGGTVPIRAVAQVKTGLSPRVRGNLPLHRWLHQRPRSIPARAGEPVCRMPAGIAVWVYPRACGGTFHFTVGFTRDPGLSPRVRGNQSAVCLPVSPFGSIPARAGEPLTSVIICICLRVYPRACGGTPCLRHAGRSSTGLSPRVRGNLLHDQDGDITGGSIPARAGEPPQQWMKYMTAWVYPRACGGTHHDAPLHVVQMGLSPRVRGNHRPAGGLWRRGGSIPARAGEPSSSGTGRDRPGVYPRACGGTSTATSSRRWTGGLSPRVRGNPETSFGAAIANRSIPARAGEPERRAPRWARRGVYPRACGGTANTPPSSQSRHGLSPRVRGNQTAAIRQVYKQGSIPARAGEPRRRRRCPAG